jgi:hypothetical protein
LLFLKPSYEKCVLIPDLTHHGVSLATYLTVSLPELWNP